MRVMRKNITSIPESKVCTKCLTDKPLTFFHKASQYLYGVTAQCIECRNKEIRAHGKRNAWKYKEPESRPSEKQCCTCKETKTREEFSSCPGKKGGLSSRCKECRRKNEGSNSEGYRFAANIRRLFGMTKEDYANLLIAQSGKCAICLVPMKKPVVDHCHVGGFVRGLLCCKCNTWLAPLEHPWFSERASVYLQRGAVIKECQYGDPVSKSPQSHTARVDFSEPPKSLRIRGDGALTA